MRGRRRQISTCLLAASLLLLAPGCETVEKYSLTHKVWTTEDWRAWSEPAPDPKLALFNHPSRRDVLVRYDALREDATAPETRAYLLQANQDRIEVGRNPHFVNPKLTKQLEAIPVFESKAMGTAAQGVLTNGAVAAKPSRTFVLYRPEQPPPDLRAAHLRRPHRDDGARGFDAFRGRRRYGHGGLGGFRGRLPGLAASRRAGRGHALNSFTGNLHPAEISRLC